MSTSMQVGEPFAPGITRFPEGSHYAWDPIGFASSAHHRLVVFAERPTPRELTAFRSGGRVELALLVEGPAVVLLWSGAGWPWSDAPYTWHLQAEGHRKAGRGEMGVPSTAPIPEGAGAPLDMILVDAASGILRAIRRVAMPGPFVLALHHAIAAQAAAPWDAPTYDATLARLAEEDPLALVHRAAESCTIGGGR